MRTVALALLVSFVYLLSSCGGHSHEGEGGHDHGQEKQEHHDEGHGGHDHDHDHDHDHGHHDGHDHGDHEELEPYSETVGDITLTGLTESIDYPIASLELTGTQNTEDGMTTFNFETGGFGLGQQTEDAETKGMANSGKGQHIHFIDNNGPYSAHYEPMAKKELTPGNHVILAFLSRSYHESVKTEGAAVIAQVQAGGEGEEQDLSGPVMFYSRPKGTYVGDGTKKVLLDFYLHNAELASDGHKVRATINGNVFTLDQWMPYTIEGAPMGELSVKLELLDAEGNLVDAPFNPVERTVQLTEAENS